MDDLTRTKLRLLARAEKAVTPLQFTRKESKDFTKAFELSFEEHQNAPPRASGEIYFMHIFRQLMKMIRLMVRFRVKSVKLLITILLHDAIENVKENGTTQFMVVSKITNLLDEEITYFVVCLTKNKEKETRDSYLIRLTICDVWPPLVAKPGDSNDNMITLSATQLASQAGKVVEIFTHFPAIKARAIHLITTEGKSGRLKSWQRWIGLVEVLHRNLNRNAKKQQQRLEGLGIEVL
jgi:hypothetical protein